MDDKFFRVLNADEEAEFRKWARDNFKLTEKVNSCWHPVVRDEWRKIINEIKPPCECNCGGKAEYISTDCIYKDADRGYQLVETYTCNSCNEDINITIARDIPNRVF